MQNVRADSWAEDLGQGQATLDDEITERFPFDVLHREEQHAVGFFDRIDRDDVGVIERGRGLGLAQEARPRLRVVTAVVEHHLQRDGAAQPCVFSLVNFAHPARSEALDDAVMRDGFADHRVVV